MAELKKTSRWGKGRAAHHHIAFLSDSGQGVTSVSVNHSHVIRWVPEQAEMPGEPAQYDELGQLLMPEVPPQPPIPAHWEVEPDPIDGHAHELEPYAAKDMMPKETDEEVVSDVINLTKEWKRAESECLEAAEQGEGFYWGDEQWEKADAQKLKDLDRACLTINKIQKHIDELCGNQRQQRTDLKYLPTEGGDVRVADILNHLTKHILEKSYYPREESKAFEDAAVCGRGNLNVYMDFSKNIQGDIKVEKFPWKDVIYGPHEKEDLADCEGLTKHRMYSKAKIKQMFPEKVKDIEANFDGYVDEKNHSIDPGPGKYYSVGTERYPMTIAGLPLVDIARKEFRLLECWRKVYERVSVVAIPSENFYFNCFGWEEKDVKAIETLPLDVQVIRKLETRYRISKVCGSVLLQDEYPADLPVDDFFVIPVYGKKRGEKWKGKVIDAVDSQREVNHRHSQLVDIGNKMVAYGWFTDPNTFVDEQEKEKFKRQSSKPGFVAEVMDINRPPLRVEGIKFPAEVVQLLQISDAAVAEQLNVTVMPTGANESAQHFMGMIQQKLKGNEFLFENLSFAKKKLGELLVPLIQKYYSPERIARIVMNAKDRQGKPAEVGDQPISEYTEEDIVTLLQTQDLTAYDVEVSEDSYSQSYRMAIFMVMREMAQAGAPIPPQMLIEFAPIPEEQKKRVIQGLEEQAAAEAEKKDADNKTEIQKTLIAQGIIPPEVQAELQPQGKQGPPPQPATQGMPNINQGVAGM